MDKVEIVNAKSKLRFMKWNLSSPPQQTTGYTNFEEVMAIETILRYIEQLEQRLYYRDNYTNKLHISKDLNSYLNFIYDTYVLEDDKNLDEKAIELKNHYKYLIDDLELHCCLKIDK